MLTTPRRVDRRSRREKRSRTASVLLILLFLLCSDEPVPSASRDPVRARKGMVVSADELASRVGVEILKKGGNAVDAAVGVGFALAVVYPQAGNIGGGGFMVIRFSDGRTTSIDFREKAPAGARHDMYLDEHDNVRGKESLYGHLACGVPGSVAGLLYALETYGTMDRDDVLDPAIKLAKKGFRIHYRLSGALKNAIEHFRPFPGSMRVFTKNGEPYQEDEVLVQKDLAKTLSKIRKHGVDGFYRGEIADLIVKEMERGGGLITYADLAAYSPVERNTVVGSYRGFEIISMGPPSSGGVLLVQLLNIVEGYDLWGYGLLSSKSVHVMAEAMKRVYADRAEYLGDSDFVDIPIEWLISKEYAALRRSQIDTMRATPGDEVHHGEPLASEIKETAHFSVVDKEGNVVSMSTTLNSWFGSKVVVQGAGFFLNSEMDDFSAKPDFPNVEGLIGRQANAIRPHKRMLSSMTPTIVAKDGRPFMVVGSPGGSKIITSVFQVIVNVIDFGLDIQEANDAPRFHHQWLPDTLYCEANGFPRDVIENLTVMGHTVAEESVQGGVEAILIDRARGWILGATDSRGYGAAVGY
ncbi:MAG: gamma-glutamyltransferase [Bacteroidota bacterium]